MIKVKTPIGELYINPDHIVWIRQDDNGVFAMFAHPVVADSCVLVFDEKIEDVLAQLNALRGQS